MRPFSSAPSANPSATLSDYIAALATPSIHKDEGLNQARKCGSHAFRVARGSNEGQVFKGGESLAVDGEQHTDRANSHRVGGTVRSAPT